MVTADALATQAPRGPIVVYFVRHAEGSLRRS